MLNNFLYLYTLILLTMIGERHQIVFVFLIKTIHFDRPNSSQIEEDGISFFKIFDKGKIVLICQFVI
jgi:hypothetical protein